MDGSSPGSSGCSEGRLEGADFGVLGRFPNDKDLKNPLRELILPDSVEREVEEVERLGA